MLLVHAGPIRQWLYPFSPAPPGPQNFVVAARIPRTSTLGSPRLLFCVLTQNAEGYNYATLLLKCS